MSEANEPAAGLIDLESIGPRLRDARISRGRTLKSTALAASVSVSYLSAVETGKNTPSLPILLRLAEALEVPPADLLAESAPVPCRLTRNAPDRPGITDLGHEDLELGIAGILATAHETGTAPVSVTDREVFIYVVDGEAGITVDGTRVLLGAGDGLNAIRARSISWDGVSARSYMLWVSGHVSA
ncbi:helix-turn-helix domain-containing protein [Embleya sp. NBC_00888]|uniref:helix-turn-helix domain-containing protein n=1 Tax=Embleya sp. NBC_00888 TaxID=2975960 RepID=UPI00386FBDD0|nr:helix-turn-helix domain-containing protein [Embleya sp. NBC_00888]